MSTFLSNILTGFGTPKKGSEEPVTAEAAEPAPPASPTPLASQHPNRVQKPASKKSSSALNKKVKRLPEKYVAKKSKAGEASTSRRNSASKAKKPKKDKSTIKASPVLTKAVESTEEAIEFASQPAPLPLVDDDSSQDEVAQTQTQIQMDQSSEEGDIPAVVSSTTTTTTAVAVDAREQSPELGEAVPSPDGDDADTTEDADMEDDDDDDEPQYDFTRLTDHRWSGDQLEIKVEWHASEATWEPETNLHADAPDALFRYWQAKGGRPVNPRDPELYDIFAIRKHNKNSSRMLVEWTGYPPSENCWVSRKVLEETAPEMVAEYRKSLPQKKK